MNILLSYIHYPVSSGRYMSAAFRRLGHDVRTCGWSTGNQVWGIGVDTQYIQLPDAGLDAALPGWRPDLVVLMDSAYRFHHPVYTDVPHVVYGVDNHVRDYRQPGITHYFLGHKAVSLMDMHAPDVSWLPCAFDPTVFRLEGTAARRYDAALVGVPYPGRRALVDAVTRAGLATFAGTGYLFDACAAIYRNSRVALNASVGHDLAQRIFENAACGCVVLTDAIPDLAEIDYPDGAIVQYQDLDDAVSRLRGILADWRQPDTRWLQAHSWDSRAATILAWYAGNCR